MRQKLKTKIVALTISAFMLVGAMTSCAYKPHKFIPSDMILNDNIKFGMTMEEIEKELGEPERIVNSKELYNDPNESSSEFIEYVYGDSTLFLTFQDFYGNGEVILTDVNAGSPDYVFVNNLSTESTTQDVIDTFTSDNKDLPENEDDNYILYTHSDDTVSSGDIVDKMQYGYVDNSSDELFRKIYYYYYDLSMKNNKDAAYDGIEYTMMFFIDRNTDKVIAMSWGAQKFDI